eukprot:3757242-Prymnesium_polylepis.2
MKVSSTIGSPPRPAARGKASPRSGLSSSRSRHFSKLRTSTLPSASSSRRSRAARMRCSSMESWLGFETSSAASPEKSAGCNMPPPE